MINLSTYNDLNSPATEPILDLVFKKLLQFGKEYNHKGENFRNSDIQEQLTEASDVLARWEYDFPRVQLARQLLTEMKKQEELKMEKKPLKEGITPPNKKKESSSPEKPKDPKKPLQEGITPPNKKKESSSPEKPKDPKKPLQEGITPPNKKKESSSPEKPKDPKKPLQEGIAPPNKKKKSSSPDKPKDPKRPVINNN